MRTVRSVSAVALVVIAVLGGGLLAFATYSAERDLSVGRIQLSVAAVSPRRARHLRPARELGYPLFRRALSARLTIDVRTVDRDAAERVANGELPDVRAVRDEARDAVAAYIRVLLLVVFLCALAAGLVVALAVRGRGAPRLRWLFAAAAARRSRACLRCSCCSLRAARSRTPSTTRTGRTSPWHSGPSSARRARRRPSRGAEPAAGGARAADLGLVGRQARGELRSAVIASDLHNNLLALPALDRAVAPGRSSSSGPHLERLAVRVQPGRRVVRIGHPFVFVSGNHDSDALVRRMALAGGIVLTQRGRVRADGGYGPVVVRVRGLRVAGTPTRSSVVPASASGPEASRGPTAAQREAFRDWLRPLLGRVDIVMVHEPALAGDAAAELRRIPPRRPLVLLTGHTHVSSFRASTNFRS